MAAPERRWAMVRIEAGDYLLPSNDGRTLWRIKSYAEDGSAEWADGRKIRGTFWGAWRYEGPPEKAEGDPYLTEWDRWEMYSSMLRTRQQAIDEALQAGPRQ